MDKDKVIKKLVDILERSKGFVRTIMDTVRSLPYIDNILIKLDKMNEIREKFYVNLGRVKYLLDFIDKSLSYSNEILGQEDINEINSIKNNLQQTFTDIQNIINQTEKEIYNQIEREEQGKGLDWSRILIPAGISIAS
jgi:hypothetical protein